MAELLDLNLYVDKLARKEPLAEAEIVKLLKMTEHFQLATHYLADCHAATAEGLPASASKTSRARYESICGIAAKLIRGDATGVSYPARNGDRVAIRCAEAGAHLATEAKRLPKPKAARA